MKQAKDPALEELPFYKREKDTNKTEEWPQRNEGKTEYGINAVDKTKNGKGEGMDAWGPMKDRDDKHNFKTITETTNNTYTLWKFDNCNHRNPLCKGCHNKPHWLADNNITQVFFSKWSVPTIQRVCTNYRGHGGELKGLILKLSEGHELTEAWPASWGRHCVSQSTVNSHQADKNCTLSALTTYGLAVLVVFLFCFSRIYREEMLANCALCDTSKNFFFFTWSIKILKWRSDCTVWTMRFWNNEMSTGYK